MGFEIFVTKTAISYIAVSLNNPAAASALADDYESVLRKISDNPFLFHHFKDAEENNTIYHRHNIRNYSIFYRLEGKRIIVCRFLYARRDLFSVTLET
ncbi:MAG: type II toxin-antitoxin system RelE/ParE family toxin [Spirochaetales bacterium]|nr:type II toxin-antitoxin system RelE/ParE family toxin [Spirochaetales bacterium]